MQHSSGPPARLFTSMISSKSSVCPSDTSTSSIAHSSSQEYSYLKTDIDYDNAPNSINHSSMPLIRSPNPLESISNQMSCEIQNGEPSDSTLQLNQIRKRTLDHGTPLCSDDIKRQKPLDFNSYRTKMALLSETHELDFSHLTTTSSHSPSLYPPVSANPSSSSLDRTNIDTESKEFISLQHSQSNHPMEIVLPTYALPPTHGHLKNGISSVDPLNHVESKTNENGREPILISTSCSKICINNLQNNQAQCPSNSSPSILSTPLDHKLKFSQKPNMSPTTSLSTDTGSVLLDSKLKNNATSDLINPPHSNGHVSFLSAENHVKNHLGTDPVNLFDMSLH